MTKDNKTVRELAAKDAEIARLKAKCDEYERQPELMAETAKEALELIKSQDARITLLERALKCVMWCDTSQSNEFSIWQNALNTVREAQRIILEAWDDKNYFWEDKNLTNKE